MAFVVINTVRASAGQLPSVIADVQRLGLDALKGQPGFRLARFVVAEDGSEAALIVEWDSRDDFVAYRQTEAGRRSVQDALELHPHIAFYDVVATVDPPGR